MDLRRASFDLRLTEHVLDAVEQVALVLFLALWLFTTLLRRAGILADNRPARPSQPHKH